MHSVLEIQAGEVLKVFEKKGSLVSLLKQHNFSSRRRSESHITFCKRVPYLAVARLLGELGGAPQVSRDLARFAP